MADDHDIDKLFVKKFFSNPIKIWFHLFTKLCTSLNLIPHLFSFHEYLKFLWKSKTELFSKQISHTEANYDDGNSKSLFIDCIGSVLMTWWEPSFCAWYVRGRKLIQVSSSAGSCTNAAEIRWSKAFHVLYCGGKLSIPEGSSNLTHTHILIPDWTRGGQQLLTGCG